MALVSDHCPSDKCDACHMRNVNVERVVSPQSLLLSIATSRRGGQLEFVDVARPVSTRGLCGDSGDSRRVCLGSMGDQKRQASVSSHELLGHRAAWTQDDWASGDDHYRPQYGRASASGWELSSDNNNDCRWRMHSR